jgi:DNA topoisomerase IB
MAMVIQATGRDARGCEQYRYHDDWREVRDRKKYERILDFARLLPDIRERIATYEPRSTAGKGIGDGRQSSGRDTDTRRQR